MGASRKPRNDGSWERGQAILRHRVERDFTVLQNAVIRDKRLSYKALGLLVKLLQLPSDFRISIAWLAQQGRTRRHAVRTAIEELETVGYMGKELTRDDSGKFAGCIWWVTDSPAAQDRDGRPVSGFPISGKPTPENHTLLSTNKQQELSGTTTTAPPASLAWPPGLPEAERVVVGGLIERLEQSAAQAVLDELAGLMAANRIKSSRIALLRALVVRVEAGAFVPAHGPAVAARRAQEAEEGRKRNEAKARRPQRSPELAKAKLAEIAAALQGPGSL